ncbi:MAG: hypothetical protein ACO3RT_10815 [Arenicellales bacterium]
MKKLCGGLSGYRLAPTEKDASVLLTCRLGVLGGLEEADSVDP